jgi:hypothetical protein
MILAAIKACLCSRHRASPRPCGTLRAGRCRGRHQSLLGLLVGGIVRRCRGCRLRRPSWRLWCSGRRLRGAVGALHSTGPLRFCARIRTVLTQEIGKRTFAAGVELSFRFYWTCWRGCRDWCRMSRWSSVDGVVLAAGDDAQARATSHLSA